MALTEALEEVFERIAKATTIPILQLEEKKLAILLTVPRKH